MFNKSSQPSEPIQKPIPQEEYEAMVAKNEALRQARLANPARLQWRAEVENMVAKVRGK